MKKTAPIVILLAIVVIAGIVWSGRNSTVDTTSSTPIVNTQNTGDVTISAPVTETLKVSNKLSSYQNSELGFSVKYPTNWESDPQDSGVTFIMPIDKSQVSTVAKLEADISVSSAKCSFPPVTTIKNRGTLVVGKATLNMISMSNSVQGRSYFNRMYSLQNGPICYTFAFSSIAYSPSSRGLTGSNITQAENNNKAVTSSADAAFTEMVKSFAIVVGPEGKDESTVPPVKK